MMKHCRKITASWLSLLLLLALTAGCTRATRQESPASRAERQGFATWGGETLAGIEHDFRIPNSTSYFEDEKLSHHMTAWPGGLYLMATATAARNR